MGTQTPLEQKMARLRSGLQARRSRRAPAVPPRTQTSVHNTDKPLLVGINYPFGRGGKCGYDFGKGPWGPRAEWQNALHEDLTKFKSLGIIGVRWFILADGRYYGLEETQAGKFRYVLLVSPQGAVVKNATPHQDLDRSRQGQWRLDEVPSLAKPASSLRSQWPRPVGHTIVEDFKKLLKAFQSFNTPPGPARQAPQRRSVNKEEILLIPSLISFEWCHPGVLSGGLVLGGRSDVINDASKRKKFLGGVLDELLDASKDYEREILAWEIMNEPEGCTIMPKGWEEGEQGKNHCTVSIEHMKEFLTDGVDRINKAGFISTIGYRRLRTISEWNIPGVQFHQGHYYPIPGMKDCYKLLYHTFSPQCFIGEFATLTTEDKSVNRHHWPDLSNQSVKGRLEKIKREGYDCAFLWSATRNDEFTDWGSTTQSDVKNYTRL